MCFVDGENLTFRAQELAKQENIDILEGRTFRRDKYVWIPAIWARSPIPPSPRDLTSLSTRSFYYTSIFGDDQAIANAETELWELGFQPKVFKKIRKEQKAKGVDIALTTDMLSHAFRGSYSTAVLIAGDGDYVPLVQEVKSTGKRVEVWFLRDFGMNERLKLAADYFFDLSREFLGRWRTERNTQPK
jgi:uncharacterized LabA/DUF88 family protein